MGKIYYDFFIKSARALLIISITFLAWVTIFVDPKLAVSSEYIPLIYLLRAFHIIICMFLLWLTYAQQSLFYENRSLILNVNLILAAIICSFLMIFANGPENMYVMSIIEFSFATVLISSIAPRWFGATLVAIFFIHITILYLGIYYAIYNYNENAQIAALSSIIVCLTTTFFINRIRYKRDKIILLESERLRQEKVALERIAELKTQFLGLVNHEIRNPLMKIKAASFVIENELEDSSIEISELGNRSLSTIEHSVDVIEKLISDLNDITASETGRFTVNLNERTKIRRLTEIIQRHFPEFRTDINLDNELIGEEIRISQVLENLISNAKKYSHDNRIEVKLFESDEDALLFQIKNSYHKKIDGNHLFQPYSRIDDNPKVYGLGLGLHISRQIVDSLNGNLTFQQDTNNACTFELKLKKAK